MDWLEFEKEALAKGYKAVCGVDEAGKWASACLIY